MKNKNISGTVEHWLYGIKEYKVLVEKDIECHKCIHVEVCDIKMERRCSNYTFGRSDEKGCDSCILHYAKYDTKQPIPCFHCNWFKEKHSKINLEELSDRLDHALEKETPESLWKFIKDLKERKLYND